MEKSQIMNKYVRKAFILPVLIQESEKKPFWVQRAVYTPYMFKEGLQVIEFIETEVIMPLMEEL